ncbi:uncharacterized protein FIBRA_01843 [Fibroporia radiculosa]|uniref:Uncharacterized protein n=1 Tax=Fibroporia radiculosa TaxID=599839 RepID=J4H1H3_9APHY|nr:uncharacterized protein FIBRA_01843 [Fibroporia radiculosa]CCL99819.1 predicted protein [Fibroporia radiculosa]
MSQFPIEIWEQVFSLACTDDGHTGRSLSQVSRFIRTVSGPYRLQNVELRGWAAVHQFKDMLEGTSPALRRVHNLFVSDHRPHRTLDEFPDWSQLHVKSLIRLLNLYSFPNEDKDKILSKANPELGLGIGLLVHIRTECENAASQALERVLQLIAPHVQTLTVPISAGTFINPLPALSELTVVRDPESRFAPPPSVFRRDPNMSFPLLRRLRLVRCYELLVRFVQAGAAPALTHIYLDDFPFVDMVIEGEFRDALTAIIYPLSADDAAPGAIASSINLNYDPCVEHVMMRLAPDMSLRLLPQILWQDERKLLQSSKVTCLRPDHRQPRGSYVWDDAKCNWLQQIASGEGCWEIDPSEVMNISSEL